MKNYGILEMLQEYRNYDRQDIHIEIEDMKKMIHIIEFFRQYIENTPASIEKSLNSLQKDLLEISQKNLSVCIMQIEKKNERFFVHKKEQISAFKFSSINQFLNLKNGKDRRNLIIFFEKNLKEMNARNENESRKNAIQIY